jgi:hypothetical protein
LLAIVGILCHSASSLSGERDRSVIRLIRYRYAASLCSMGWFEVDGGVGCGGFAVYVNVNGRR